MTDVHRRRIKEHSRRLGRHVLHDPESKAYSAEAAAAITSVAHKAVGLPLDQGPVGKCTCEALCGALNSQPDYKGAHVYSDVDTDRLYEVETRLEGHPWTPGDTQDDIGGSGLMVCKAAKELGWVRSYRHAFGLEHALRALVLRPVIFGVDWYSGFDAPDAHGLVKPTGHVRGGHEICALQIIAEKELVGFAQSWGLQYGVANPAIGLDRGGAFFMSFATVDRLLSEEGDATVPTPAA